MARFSPHGPLCCLAAALASCGSQAPVPPRQAPSERVVRKAFAFAGHRFVQTTRHRAFPLDPRVERAPSGMNSQPPSETVSVAAIARPRTAAESGWNAFVAGFAAELLRDEYAADRPNPLHPMNVSITIEPAAVGPDFIEASWESYSYWYNRPYGSSSTGSLLWSLSEGRQLTVEDIFRPGSGWHKALALPLTRRLIEPEPVDRPAEGYTELQRSQSPAVVAEGLWLRFKEKGNERWWQGQPACLTWSQLKPYLRERLPFDLSTLRWTKAAAGSCLDDRR